MWGVFDILRHHLLRFIPLPLIYIRKKKYLTGFLESSCQLGINRSPNYVRRAPHAGKSSLDESRLRWMNWRISHWHVRGKPQIWWRTSPRLKDLCRKIEYIVKWDVKHIYTSGNKHHRNVSYKSLTSFARSPSMLKSSRGFTVASFIDKNWQNKTSESNVC